MRPGAPFIATAVVVLAIAGASRAAEEKKPLSESQKIDALIAAVDQLKDARFVRNGTEYDCKAAADHMRRKRKAAGDRVKTARDFIAHVASKSSRSGEPYRIKFKDGKETTSGEFLTKELEKVEGKKE
jgi:hypothetical protein